MGILITGSKGQLGQSFQTFFKREGINFFATDVELDITNFKKLREYVSNKDIDIIINCAAYNAVDNAEIDWQSAYRINGIGPKNLALLANELNAVLVHYSTDYVFDGRKGFPYTIFDKPSPISKYGESKVLGERNVQNIANRFFLLRLSWVFGKGNDNFITKTIKWSRNKNNLRIVIDQISSPSYTNDIVKATYNLIKTENYGLYHMTNSGYCSRYQWAEYILNKINWEGELLPALSHEFNTPAKRPFLSVLDSFGLEEVIGYKLPSWQDATDNFLKEVELIK